MVVWRLQSLRADVPCLLCDFLLGSVAVCARRAQCEIFRSFARQQSHFIADDLEARTIPTDLLSRY